LAASSFSDGKGTNNERKIKMKTKIISKILLSLGLMFVLGSAIRQVHGGVD
jgi:hypothetical protein